jgi:two-component system LytT family response regulator
MITALVVDDESLAVQRLTGMLETMPDVDVIGTSSSVAEAERFLRRRVPDVVFLDMTMPGRLGIDLLPSVDPRTAVVFVTAYDTFAVTAFERGAVDYLLKPFDRERLELALTRVRARLAARAEEATAEQVSPEEGADREARLSIGDLVAIPRERGRKLARVPVADIVWIEAVQNCSRVQVGGENSVLMNRPLAEWEALLPAGQFDRIGRSLIIQVGRLRSSEWQSRDQTLLFFEGVEAPLPIGRTASARVKELLRAAEERG